MIAWWVYMVVAVFGATIVVLGIALKVGKDADEQAERELLRRKLVELDRERKARR